MLKKYLFAFHLTFKEKILLGLQIQTLSPIVYDLCCCKLDTVGNLRGNVLTVIFTA